jgi:hypothetical protein
MMTPARLWLPLAALGLVLWPRPQPEGAAPPRAAAGFRILFGLTQKTGQRSWTGGVRNPAQARVIRGWHFSEADAIKDASHWDITVRGVARWIPAKAALLEVLSPEEQPVTLFAPDGDFSFVPAQIPYGRPQYVEKYKGDVAVERVPLPATVSGPEYEDDDPALLRTRQGRYWMAWVAYKTRSRDGYFYNGADEIMVASGADGLSWSRPVSITAPGDHFRVALGEDSRGRVWCVYAAQKRMGTGNFDLFAKVLERGKWSAERQLTDSPLPDVFHRMAADRQGNLYLVWMGYRPTPGGGRPQSDILMRVNSGGQWGAEVNVSQSPEDDWEPAIAVGETGPAFVVWDSYRASGARPANYDLLLRRYSGGTLGPVQVVSGTAFAEMKASAAVDGGGRLWVAWEEGPPNWGKDTGYENPAHRIFLKPGGSRIYGPELSAGLYRRPRVAVLDGAQWMQPRAELEKASPGYLASNLFQNPRLGVDGAGQVWLFMRNQKVATGRGAGQFFDFYATTMAGAGSAQRWLTPVLLPASTGRQDTQLATAPAPGGGIVAGVVGDGRMLPVALPRNHDVATLLLEDRKLERAAPVLLPFQPSPSGELAATHTDEVADVARVRRHRIAIGGQTYKIVRGDTHRHTDISMDGGVDGSLFELYRYAMNAADFDFVGVTDHNYGAWLDTDEPESKNTDSEYQWWRTQKSADIFFVPGRFVPLYGYERSINFPLGHRNIFHVRRGVFSYRVPKLNILNRPELIDGDARGYLAYLRATDGVGLPHSTGTNMGTDWRRRDDQLEPVAEIYQGDRNAYDGEGGPRVSSKSAPGPGKSGVEPHQNGLIWNALGAGYKMGFIASSDHWSTHISYANLLVPDRITTRADIQQALRARRSYASTDNMVVDFRAGNTLQGGETTAAAPPVFEVDLRCTQPILRVEVIRNNRIIHTRKSDQRTLRFTFRDEAPEPAASYYYIRVIQSYSAEALERDGEVAWASPIWVARK